MADSNPSTKGKEDWTKPALEKAGDVGSQAAGKVKEMAASVGEMATHTASAVGKKADDLTASAGGGIKKLGDTIAAKAPHEGVVGAAAQTVAKTLKDGGQYLEDAQLSGMAKDATQLIQRNPIPAVLISLGVGFLIGRAMRS